MGMIYSLEVEGEEQMESISEGPMYRNVHT